MRTDYLTAKDVVALLKNVITTKTLANWRCDPKNPGPKFARFGNRILYAREDVEKWAETKKFVSTTQYTSTRENGSRKYGFKFEANSLAELKKELDDKLMHLKMKREELDGMEGELLWLFDRRAKEIEPKPARRAAGGRRP